MACPKESLAVTLRAATPSDAAGFGVPLGPAVMEIAWVPPISWRYDGLTVINPSSTSTMMRQVPDEPVRLGDAVHLGVGELRSGGSHVAPGPTLSLHCVRQRYVSS